MVFTLGWVRQHTDMGTIESLYEHITLWVEGRVLVFRMPSQPQISFISEDSNFRLRLLFNCSGGENCEHFLHQLLRDSFSFLVENMVCFFLWSSPWLLRCNGFHLYSQEGGRESLLPLVCIGSLAALSMGARRVWDAGFCAAHSWQFEHHCLVSLEYPGQ